MKCEECEIRPSKTGLLCSSGIIRWLYEEYTSPVPKLTKREHAFCEAVGEGWIARNRNNMLYLHEEKMVQSYYAKLTTLIGYYFLYNIVKELIKEKMK